LKDKSWRINNLYKIVNKKGKKVTYRENKVQQQVTLSRHTRNIDLKGRQTGMTTRACIHMLDEVLFKPTYSCFIIAHKLDAIKKIFKKIKIAYDSIPQEVKDFVGWEVFTDSANELSFSHGSVIGVGLSSRSDTINHLHISEFGKICKEYPTKAEEIITGAVESVPMDGFIDIESTAEGSLGYFHDMFWEAWEVEPQSKLDWKSHFWKWTDMDEYQLEGEMSLSKEALDYQLKHKLTDAQINWWFQKQKTLKDKMFQEYPTIPEEAFDYSGNKMFDIDTLNAQKILIGKKEGEWTFYKDYIPEHRYSAGADVSEGVGRDASTIVILDLTEMEVVATYKYNKIDPSLFAYEIRNGCNMYGACLVAPERNNHGHATLSKLKEIYPQEMIYTYVQEDRIQKINTTKWGWLTTAKTKPTMLYDLKEIVNNGEFTINDRTLLMEMKMYDKNDLNIIKYDVNVTKHFDLLIATSIAYQIAPYAEKASEEDSEEAFDDLIRFKI